MASIAELRRIARECEEKKALESAANSGLPSSTHFSAFSAEGDEDTTIGGTNANATDPSSSFVRKPKANSGGASYLPPFSDLLAMNQPKIDAIETEIHNILSSFGSSSASSSSEGSTAATPAAAAAAHTSSDLLAAWLRLIGVHQHMATEAARVVRESGAIDAEIVATIVRRASVSASVSGAAAAAVASDSRTPTTAALDQTNDSAEVNAEETKTVQSPAVAGDNDDDDDFDISGAAEEGNKQQTAVVESKRTISFDDDATDQTKIKTKSNGEEKSTTAPSRKKQKQQQEDEAPKFALSARLPSGPVPALLVEAFNSLNVTFERALRSMAEDPCRIPPTTRGGGKKGSDFNASLLLSLLLRRDSNKSDSNRNINFVSASEEGPTAANAVAPPASAEETAASATLSSCGGVGSAKLWRMYISARVSQALALRLPLRRVLYPLFDRALAAVTTGNNGGGKSLSPLALRLWLDYCDLCLYVSDFTKLRVVLQGAFDALPSAAHHTRLWQFIRHRIFCLSGATASNKAARSTTTTSTSEGNNSNSSAGGALLTRKMIADSAVLSAIAKYNDSLDLSDVRFAIADAAAAAADVNATAEGDGVVPTENRSTIDLSVIGVTNGNASPASAAASKKKLGHRRNEDNNDDDDDDDNAAAQSVASGKLSYMHPLAFPLAAASASATPRPVVALFWAEYIRAFPTQRTLSEYLSFLAASVYSAVDAYHHSCSLSSQRSSPDEDDDDVAAAKIRVTEAISTFMNFVMEKAFNSGNKNAAASSSTIVGASSSSSLLAASPDGSASSAAPAGISVSVEVWETIAFALQHVVLANAAASSTPSSSPSEPELCISPNALRRWIEAIVSGLERSAYESDRRINKMVSSSLGAAAANSNNDTVTSSSAANNLTISPVHVKAKIDIFLSCAVALAHFSLFDEAFELLWDYVVKAKGAFGQVEIFQKIFAFTCGMLQSLAGQCVAVCDDISSSSSANKTNNNSRIASIAEVAVARLASVTASYDRLRLDIALRADRRNVSAWLERVALYRDAFEEKRPVDGAVSASSPIVDAEMMKHIYASAINSLSSIAATSGEAASSPSSVGSGGGSAAAAELLLLSSGSASNNNATSSPSAASSSAFSADALAAVTDLYEEFANFVYYTLGDYDYLRTFLRRSILTADFGGAGAEEDGSDDDETDDDGELIAEENDDDEDENEGAGGDDEAAGEKKRRQQRSHLLGQKRRRAEERRKRREFKEETDGAGGQLKGAKGIRVNVRLFGLLLDKTLAHSGPAATRDLLISWIKSECPLPTYDPSSTSSSSGGGKGKGSSSSSSSAAALLSSAAKKREQEFYRHVSSRSTDKLKQRRTEGGMFGGGGGLAMASSSASGGTSSAGGVASSLVGARLWLSEEMWDLCLHFANLVDRQLLLLSSSSSATAAGAAGDDASPTASSASAEKAQPAQQPASAAVWGRCVSVGMASPWLSMRVVTRLLSAAGAQNLPVHTMGREMGGGANDAVDESSSFASVLAKASETIPDSLFTTSPDWGDLPSLVRKFAAANGSRNNNNVVNAAGKMKKSAAAKSTSFELFAVDNLMPTAVVKKQLTATRDALAALASALAATADPIAVARLALWKVNLQSEEGRLAALLLSRRRDFVVSDAAFKNNTNNNAANGDNSDEAIFSALFPQSSPQLSGSISYAAYVRIAVGAAGGGSESKRDDIDASALLVREAVRDTVASAMAQISAANHTHISSAAAASLSAAASELLLRYMWFEAQQAPAAASSSATDNSSNQHQYAHSHNIESFEAYGMGFIPLLLCPATLLCTLVLNAEEAVNASRREQLASQGGRPAAASSTAADTALAKAVLSEADRYKVLDVLLKTLVATRGVDFATFAIRKSIASTSSPIDVAFLAPRLAACLAMAGDVAAARSVFDKVAPTQVQATIRMVGGNPNQPTANAAAAAAAAAAQLTTAAEAAALIPTVPRRVMKAFWGSWLGFENAHGNGSTMETVHQWYSRVQRHLGPLVVSPHHQR